MKLLGKLYFLLFASTTLVTAQTPETKLIEDFEDKNSQNLLGGYWYDFNDNDAGGKSRLKDGAWLRPETMAVGGYNSTSGLKVDVILEKADYKWSPYFSFGTQLSKSSDYSPKDFAGISYWHKGVAHAFRVDIQDVQDYDYHMFQVPASDEWTLVTVDFNNLNQGGWGKKVNFNLDNDLKLVWSLDQSSGNFQIDDIQFVRDIVYEKQNDMKVLPAEIPAPVSVKGNVNTPLNKLSQKYLTKGMNLTNWGESDKITNTDPNTWKYNESVIKLQADQGMLGIRFPIDLDLYILDRDKVLKGTTTEIEFEPLLLSLLDSMNIWTKRHGLSYTLDYHAYDGTYNRKNSKDPEFRKAMARIWKEIALHFKDEKREDLFFELTNEPCLSLPEGEFIDQADWTLLAGMMIDEIRKVDKKRPLIFGDTKWYSLDELVKNKPFEDKYVIYSFHMYDPFLFSHQGAGWTNMGSMKNIPFPYSEEKWSTEYRDFGINASTPEWVKELAHKYYKEGNKQHIKNRLATVKNWAFDHNVPLICNEWGALPNTAKIEDLNAYFKAMGEIFNEMDISWQVWFGVMDSEYKLLPGMAEALDLKAK